jgi:hypothetical protein
MNIVYPQPQRKIFKMSLDAWLHTSKKVPLSCHQEWALVHWWKFVGECI